MDDISLDNLSAEIQAILETATLSETSSRDVRKQVETKLNCSLVKRKKEFDKIVMDFVNTLREDEEEVEFEEENNTERSGAENEEKVVSNEEQKRTGRKRPEPIECKPGPSKKKYKPLNVSDSATESDSSDDSDVDVKKMKKKSAGPKKKKVAATRGARKYSGFSRTHRLSPELSSLMGAESLPYHEVVRKVWSIIRERNLYDPTNRQYAICDNELMDVVKKKRFRIFGMLELFKPHFLD